MAVSGIDIRDVQTLELRKADGISGAKNSKTMLLEILRHGNDFKILGGEF